MEIQGAADMLEIRIAIEELRQCGLNIRPCAVLVRGARRLRHDAGHLALVALLAILDGADRDIIPLVVFEAVHGVGKRVHNIALRPIAFAGPEINHILLIHFIGNIHRQRTVAAFHLDGGRRLRDHAPASLQHNPLEGDLRVGAVRIDAVFHIEVSAVARCAIGDFQQIGLFRISRGDLLADRRL